MPKNANESVRQPRGPVLLFSLPRSGSTWIGKILDSHPDTVYRHEPDSRRKIANVPVIALDTLSDSQIATVRDFYEGFATIRGAKVCGKTPVFGKSYLSKLRYVAYQSGIAVSKIAGKLGVEAPVYGVPAVFGSDRRPVWKSIESLGRLGLVLNALTDSLAVHLLRHPCGYVASVLRGESMHRFEDNRGASEDYGILQMLLDTDLARERGLTLDGLKALSPGERLAWRWSLTNDKAIRDTAQVGRCRVVCYESVCEDPMAEMQSMFEFLGLAWNPQTIEFIEKSTGQHSASYYSVFKDSRKASVQWREELDEQTVRKILAIASESKSGQFYGGKDQGER